MSSEPLPAPRTGRCAAHGLRECYVVVASGREDDIKDALLARRSVEEDPALRAGLVLAAAQLARERGDPEGEVWTRMLWSDPQAPPKIRASPALGWMCLMDAAIPDELRVAMDECATDATGRLMASLPWMRAVDYEGHAGLRTCVRLLLSPDAPNLV